MNAVASGKNQRALEKLSRELGPVAALLEDDTTEDIVRNPNGRLWVLKTGGGFLPAGEMTDDQAYSVAGTIVACRDAVINHDNPILEATIPSSGARIEVVLPPVTSSPAFGIRLRPRSVYSLGDYASAQILTGKDDPLNKLNRKKTGFLQEVRGLPHVESLRRAVRRRMNILVIGGTGTGKTTFANAVLSEVAQECGSDRVLIIEDTPELQCAVPNCVELQSSQDQSLDHCLRAALRLRPTRIIVGEVRGREALGLLKAWSTGHPGGLATIHGNDAAAGLAQLENLVAEATSAPKQALIAEAVQLVVFIDSAPELPVGRKVREIAVVTGYQNGKYTLESI